MTASRSRSAPAPTGPTILDVLSWRARHHPDRTACVFLRDGERDEERLTYGDLDAAARRFATGLCRMGAEGQRVLLAYPTGLEFVVAFIGCMLAGALPVPAAPAGSRRRRDRLLGIARDCRAATVIGIGRDAELVLPSGTTWKSHADVASTGAEPVPARSDPDAPALLQYSSGSTSSPRGVVVTHANLVSNEISIRDAFAHREGGVVVGWLPLHHDMGLIGNLLQPLFAGMSTILMSPEAFLQRPMRWLEAVSRFRATTSGGPTFAYRACIEGARQAGGIDLSSWSVAFAGAEMVSAEVIAGFEAAFSPHGFRGSAFLPCYGLAEATLMATSGAAGRGARVLILDRDALARGSAAAAVAGGCSRSIVSCGTAPIGSDVVIVDPSTGARVPDGRVGEIWVSGMAVAAGYWSPPEDSSDAFVARLIGEPGRRYLRTGDLGFVLDGEIYPTGRIKDVLVVRGEKHHPEDIEATLQASDEALRRGRGTAFAMPAAEGEDALCVLHEVRPGDRDGWDDVATRIRADLLERHGLRATMIALTRLGSLPRTTSGKLRRSESRDRFLADRLPIVHRWSCASAHGDPGWLSRAIRVAGGDPEAGSGMGLDSLGYARLAWMIGDAFGLVLPLADLASLDRDALERRLPRRRPDPGGPIEVGSAPAFALTRAQREIWLHDVAGGSVAQTIIRVARIRGPLDERVVRSALQSVWDRHPALRTRVAVVDSEPRQDHGVQPLVPMVVEDPTGPDGLADRVAAIQRRPWSTAEGPLCRFHLWREGAAHILVVSAHHLVTDLWSSLVVLDEVMTLCSGSACEEPAAVGFRAYARAQEARRRSAASPRAPRAEPRGEGHRIDLAGDVAASGVGRSEFTIPAHVARRLDPNRHAALVAALHVALHAVSGRRGIAIGIPLAGRVDPRFDRVVGCLIGTAVIACELPAGERVGDLVGRVRDVLGEAVGPSHGCEAEAAAAGRTADAWLSYQRTIGPRLGSSGFVLGLDGPPIRRGELSFEPVGVAPAAIPFDLMVAVADAESGSLRGTISYRKDRVGDHLRVLSAYLAALEAISASPEREVAEIVAPAPRPLTLGARFRERSAERPDAIAVVSGDVHITYGAMAQRSAALTRELIADGMRGESPVGLLVDRSVWSLIGMIAIVDGGGCYVPLEPALPRNRAVSLLRKAGATLLVTDRAEPIDPGIRGVHPVQHGPPLLAMPAVVPAQAAYVIHTSGTSGEPKGVVISHEQVGALVDGLAPRLGLRPDDAWTLFHSFMFDFSVWEIWGALLTGARLVVVGSDVARAPDRLVDLIRDEGVTIFNQTPSAFGRLNALGLEVMPESLRLVIFGGEALSFPLLRRWLEASPTRPSFVNMYGITETTVHVSILALRDDAGSDTRSLIGVAAPGRTIALLDASLRRVPRGHVGEICVGGDCVSRGYLGSPALTAERFVPDPFSGRPGARLYRSGDLARECADGGFEYLGRADRQIKLNGYRIELAGIEAALSACDGVAQAAVTIERSQAWDQEPGGTPRAERVFRPDADAGRPGRMVAYVVMARDARWDPALLRRRLGVRLPSHEIPAAFVELPSLPLNANGKIDAARLPEVPTCRPDIGPYRPAATQEERLLVAVYAEGLAVTRVGVDDDYFALGGDSMRSLRIQSACRRAGYHLDIAELLSKRTPRAVAISLRPLEESGGAASEPFAMLDELERRALPRDVVDAYPASSLQAGMLFHASEDPGRRPYHDVFWYGLEGRFDASALRSAMARVVSRHAALRTSFAAVSGRMLQRVHADAAVPLTVEDLVGVPEPMARASLRQAVRGLLRIGFDPATVPLVRVHAQILGALEFRLVLCFHDAILDGWSVAQLLRELLVGYAGALSGARYAPLPPPLVAYRDFVAAELAASADAAAAAYWRDRLSGNPAGTLLSPAGVADGGSVRVVGVPIDVALGEALDEAARRIGVQRKHVLLAAHVRVVAAMTGSLDIVTGVESNGRLEKPGAEDVLGLHLNLLPYRFRLAGATWRTVALAAAEAELSSAVHRRFPYAEIQRVSGASHLVETSFNFTHFHGLSALVADTGLIPLSAGGREHTSLALKAEFNVDPFTRRLGLELECESSRIPDDMAGGLARAYAHALASLARDPDSLVTGAVLDQHDRCAMGTAAKRVERPLALLVLDSLRRDADRVALRCEHRQLTYAAFDRWTGALAVSLHQRGVSVGDRVAVVMERGLASAVAMVAAIRLGAAFLPVDPHAPVSWRRSCISSGRARVALAEAGSLDAAMDLGVPVVAIDASAPTAAAVRDLPVPPDGELAVLFTSGSTGRPKAVSCTAAGLVNRAQWFAKQFPYADRDIACLKTSLAFVDSIAELLCPLLAGACVAIVPPAAAAHPTRFISSLEAEQVTRLVLVPSLLRTLLDSLGDRRLPSLSLLTVSGEAATATLATLCASRLPHVRLLNLYGCAEASADATWHLVDPLRDREVVPIGTPITNTSLRLLDPAGQPVPAGMVGEIHIGGDGLAFGYDGDPAATAERFLPDPTSDVAGARLYRTGDLAVICRDGSARIIGRRDRQLKIRGIRVDPRAIEEVLERDLGARAAAVIPVGEDARRTLVAFVVAGGTAIDGAWRDRLRDALPPHLVPHRVIEVPELPHTSGGKVDRLRLASLAGSAERAAPRPPEGTVETALAGIWRDALGRSTAISRDDRFVEIGGDSLSAMVAVAKASAAFGVDVGMRQFMHATLAQLAQDLGAKAAAAPRSGSAAPLAASLDPHRPFPVNDIQRAYLLGRSRAIALGGIACRMHADVALGDHIDLGRLEAAWNALILRHDQLRAVFDADAMTQRVLPETPWYALRVDDLRTGTTEDCLRALDEGSASIARGTVDASTWPLFGIRAFLLPDGRRRLLIGIDMLIADAGSLGILLHELRILHDGRPLGASPPVRFADLVRGQREPDPASVAYWRDLIPSLPPRPDLPLLANHARPRDPGFRRHAMAMDAQRWRRATAAAAAARLTPSGLLLGCFAEILAAWSCSRAFSVNVATFGRPADPPEAARVVGDFTTVALIAVDHDVRRGFTERLAAVQACLWDAMEHRAGSGTWVLREWARLHRATDAAVMPIVFTSALGPEQDGLALEWLGQVRSLGAQTPQVWIDCQVFAIDGALHVGWDVADGIFPTGLIEQMFTAFGLLLEGFAAADGAFDPVGSASRLISCPLPAPPADAAAPASLLDGLDAASRDVPDRVAVIDGARCITYGTLAAAAAGVASRLVALGIRPGDLVGVRMGRGWRQVAAVLGIARAGAAYVPIDPESPPERVERMRERAGLRLVLVSCDEPQAPFTGATAAIGPDCIAADPAPRVAVDPDDLAYVIFTSGSTGDPKGVMITHRAAANTIADINYRIELGPRDRVLGLSALSFDLSVYDIFGTIAAAAALVVMDESQRRSPKHWSTSVREQRVTVWNSVPLLMDLALAYEDGRSTASADPWPIRQVLLSGDWIPVTLPSRVWARSPAASVLALGGATEAAIWSVAYPLTSVDDSWRSIPYGRALTHQRVQVLGPDLEPCPQWVVGELAISGAGLANGYLGDARLTGDRFVRHPRTGERHYLTGDLCRWLPDGELEFLGRRDHQVKIDGNRIELGDVEHALLADPRVAAAAAAVERVLGRGDRLVAQVVPARGVELRPESVIEEARSRLPPAMVPVRIAIAASLPMGPNGKVDRNAIAAGGPPPASPSGPDDRFHRLVEGVLGQAVVDPDRTLIDAGATSVDMIRIANAVERELGVELPFDAMYYRRSIAELGAIVSRSVGRPAGGCAEPTAPVATTGGSQAAGTQHRLSGAADGMRSFLDAAEERRSCRRFRLERVADTALGGWLECLRERADEGGVRRLYPSSGGLGAIRAYLVVKRSRVAGIAPGAHAYDPAAHALRLVARGYDIDPALHEPFVNRPAALEAAFTVLLVADLGAFRAKYGDHGRDLALVEAGYVGQLLASAAAPAGLGICPVGIMDFAAVRPHLGLAADHDLLHALIGGVPDRGPIASKPSERLRQRIDGLDDQQVDDLLGEL